jgi:hypothetical protein
MPLLFSFQLTTASSLQQSAGRNSMSEKSEFPITNPCSVLQRCLCENIWSSFVESYSEFSRIADWWNNKDWNHHWLIHRWWVCDENELSDENELNVYRLEKIEERKWRMRKWWSTSTNLRLKQATLGIETWWEFEDLDKTRPQRTREMIEFDYLISEFYLEVNVSCFPSFMFE